MGLNEPEASLEMRLDEKVALVTGSGQTPGETIGNGRATALTYARAGARVAVVDCNRASAEETVAMIKVDGGTALALEADVTREEDCQRLAAMTMAAFGRIDILHNNVGDSPGDAGPTSITAEAWRRILDMNLTSMLLTSKHVLPVMRAQGSGVIINISSIISLCSDTTIVGSAPDQDEGVIAYKTSKAGVNALTESMAMSNARYGIRVNAILPGLMDTPTAIEGLHQQTRAERSQLRRVRDAQVPLGNQMGSAWDVANAALFLCSGHARFITGVLLTVDGGHSLRRG